MADFACQSAVAGATLILCGVISIILNFVDLVVGGSGDNADVNNPEASSLLQSLTYMFCSAGYVGHGFWCGSMCVVAGSFGIIAGRHRTKRSIFAFMVLSIITGALCIGQFVAGAYGARIASLWLEMQQLPGAGTLGDICQPKIHIAMESLLACVAVIGGAVSTWGSVNSCRVMGCWSEEQDDTQMIIASSQQHQAPLTQMPNMAPSMDMAYGYYPSDNALLAA